MLKAWGYKRLIHSKSACKRGVGHRLQRSVSAGSDSAEGLGFSSFRVKHSELLAVNSSRFTGFLLRKLVEVTTIGVYRA